MIIAVDFDGTIVTHEYPRIGREIPFAIDTLKRFQDEAHHLLILWTVREGTLLEEAVEFCRARGLEFYAINNNYPEVETIENQPRKLSVELFIDDRNLGGLPDWGVIYRMVMSGNPWASVSSDFIPDPSPKRKGWFGRQISGFLQS